ncbi:hypothetical protein QQF64_025259 [Cirrhinus molitorella]|uniref:Ig-like domain-containing protein n=1 Tax=Cirrhinus molitorella TaxID=172907 RepID=A0ABR3NPK9_9TELE
MLLLQELICILLISLAHGVHDSCPIMFDPPDVVVEFGASFSVNCSSTNVTHQFGLSWEGPDDTMENTEEIIRSVDKVTDWEMNKTCFMYSNETKCSQDLPITIYKTPDNVSISFVNHSGPMIEGNQYELKCDIQNVAPVQDLTVKWYKGQTLLDQTTFNDTSKTPVNETATLLITADRADDGAQYRCEAELDLGDGPQIPIISSEPLSFEVHYKPKHSNLTVFIIKNNEVMLNCTVKANPTPTYTWHSEHLKEKSSSSVLPSSTLSPGNYTCTTENSVGRDSKVFIVSDSECPVQIIPQRAVVEYGSSVAVDCRALIPHDGMAWEADEGGTEKTSANVTTWNVSNLREWEIKPFCYINYIKIANTPPCEVQLPVTVYKTPDNVSISFVNHSGPMIEGKQYELQCDVQDVAPVQNLTVKWYKGQTLLNQTTFTDTIKTPVNETATLLITADRADDGAQYRCEAELDLGAEGPQPLPQRTSEPFSITVYYAPEIQSCNSWSPLKGTSLDSLHLNVYSVVGNPHPNISWSLNSSPVNSSRNLTENDSGQYKITATNVLNVSSCFINIKVQYPPELKCNESYKVKENTLFQFPCTANGLPKPELSLYKNGKVIQHEFFKPSWNDSGLYQLITRNQHGTVNSTFTVNILHAPVFYSSQENFVVGENSNITLECSSSGNPEPEMWWSFKNKNISTGRRHITFNIGRATSTNAGNYTCVATNEFGRRVKSFVVEIRDDSSNYILFVVLILLVLLILFIIVVIFLRRRNKLRGRYEIQSAKQYEMRPLSNGGPE